MIDSIEAELSIFVKANACHLIPSHLLSYFEKDINQRILPNLVGGIDSLLQTIDANNFAKILSFKDTADENTNANSTSSSLNGSNVSDSVACSSSKSSLLEICSRLSEILSKYNNELNAYLNMFDKLKVIHGRKVEFPSTHELLVYQRSIFIQKLSSKHYDMFGLLFRNVFDFYQKRSRLSDRPMEDEEDVETIDDKLSPDEIQMSRLNSHPLIESFHRINQIV